MFSKLVLNGILLYYWASPAVSGSNSPILNPNRDVLSQINRMAVEIMSQCYGNFEEIVVYSDSDDSVIKYLQASHQFNVVVANSTSEPHHGVPPRSRINVLLVRPSDPIKRSVIFTIPKNLSQLDPNAQYFILDRTDSKCAIAYPILKLAWKIRWVNSHVLCVDDVGTSLIITYNPYVNRAPQSWLELTYRHMPSDEWTLIYYTHSAGIVSCEDFAFDRLQYIASRSFVDRLSVNSRLFAFIVFLAIVSNIEFLSFLDHLGILPFWRMITNSQHHSIANIFNDSGKQSNN